MTLGVPREGHTLSGSGKDRDTEGERHTETHTQVETDRETTRGTEATEGPPTPPALGSWEGPVCL